jgi:hypothetical protein
LHGRLAGGTVTCCICKNLLWVNVYLQPGSFRNADELFCDPLRELDRRRVIAHLTQRLKRQRSNRAESHIRNKPRPDD